MGYKAAEIHSNRSLAQRRQALEGFRRGLYRILVATDIASRGIDVMGIELVLNYDLPEDPENYVHRIGRTGRAGHKGLAISIATPDQKSDVRNIEKLIRASLPVIKHRISPLSSFGIIPPHKAQDAKRQQPAWRNTLPWQTRFWQQPSSSHTSISTIQNKISGIKIINRWQP